MYKSVLIFTFVFGMFPIYFSQNLVMNPSFEEYWNCPTQVANARDCKYVFDPQCIQEPFPCVSTSDYFNKCAPINNAANIPYAFSGYQHPRNGDGFLGFLSFDTSGYREYVQIKLNTSLSAGSKYPFSFFVNLANESHMATDAIGVKFVTDSIYYTNQYLWEIMDADWVNDNGNFVIDTLEWTKLSGEYVAQGGEQWMIIGVFHQEKLVPSIIVNPNANPSWKNCIYYYIDDVSVDYAPLQIPNIFTPNNDQVNDRWITGGNITQIKIMNRWGNAVFEASNSFQGWDGKNQKGEYCSEGVYFYQLYDQNPFDQSIKSYSGFITLMR